jgi:uncharacterized protein YjiK
MKLRFIIALALMIPLAGCWRQRGPQAKAPYPELELVSARVIDMPAPLEPSGLAWHRGELYTVADKDNRTIYRIRLDGETATLEPAIRIDLPDGYYMDWEGITTGPDGTFHLVSEERGRILRVQPDGSSAWATPDLRADLKAGGLYAKGNAGFEGVVNLGEGHWLAAAEREPRGLVEIRGDAADAGSEIFLMEHSPFGDALPLLRLPDYSGMDSDRGKIYALFRNAHLVVRLDKVDGAYRETDAWSYRHIEIDPRWAYQAQVYGQGEGLVVNGRDIYIVFDNNLGPRLSDSNDGRPLLVHARFPEGH